VAWRCFVVVAKQFFKVCLHHQAHGGDVVSLFLCRGGGVIVLLFLRYPDLMRNLLSLPTFLLIALLTVGCQSQSSQPTAASVSPDASSPMLPAEMVAQRTRGAAVAVLASLNAEQRASATRAIDDPLRVDWHFVPRQREGLRLGDLDVQQKTLVHDLLQTALSDTGYLHAVQIMWLETVLGQMEDNPRRDPGAYALLIFGDPSDADAAWGWRLEGHHLSLNLTYTADDIAVTPMFYGTNPAVVPQGFLAGTRVLSDAHHLAIALAESMTDEQRALMVLAEKPGDVITGPGRESAIGEQVGISIDQLTATQQDMLLELMLSHLSNLESSHAASLYMGVVNLYGDAPLLHGYTFAWAGPIDADQPFYYRIHSPRFVIEYSCQNRNHVHAVMHDLTDPLGQDMLRLHYEQHDHEHAHEHDDN